MPSQKAPEFAYAHLESFRGGNLIRIISSAVAARDALIAASSARHFLYAIHLFSRAIIEGRIPVHIVQQLVLPQCRSKAVLRFVDA